MSPPDAVLTCRDCLTTFVFSEEERRTFAAMDHHNAPSRCPGCRSERKTRQEERGSRVVAPRFRELQQTRTTVICSSCGEAAVVPFAARPGRSVYCSTCYDRRRRQERDA